MKAHDLPRNSVVAIVYSSGDVSTFLHINNSGLINPFWVRSNKKEFEKFGDFGKYDFAGNHEHWRNGIESQNVVMVQSHVTSAAKVDFKRCMKFFKKLTKR